ncbi:family 78 glycoside hydrolase catalytic domain [Streptomyces sp. NPDC005485]|uniref:family 78 glycoside hydrolase catalytic domain n=1 Tax=Streptomyces sp. NPDC005485 TaxID=3155591 RepID=UPI0033B06564
MRGTRTTPGCAPVSRTRAEPESAPRTTTTPASAPTARRRYGASPTCSASGALLLDTGQNPVGRLKLRARKVTGTVITPRHAEVLEDGELCDGPCVRPWRPTTSP